MPFSAILIVPKDSTCLKLLRESNAIRTAIENASEWNGQLKIDVLPLLLLMNIYGHQSIQDTEEVALWENKSLEDLLVEKDLTSPEYSTFIGDWNLQFLRWLKGISIVSQECLKIYYDHERGDTLYEQVQWV